MIYSLAMRVEVVDGKYLVEADWLTEPVIGDTWPEAYELAMRARRTR